MKVDSTQEFQLPARYHQALQDWQQRNFAELPLLQQHWSRFFEQQPYQLCAKVSPLKSSAIEVGMFKGKSYVERAVEMRGNMLYSALRIIRAQCSTELGSIQQHLETLDSGIDERAQFSILRICAEELRHAYQMFWVLSHDPSWAEAGIRNVADQTMDELLEMRTGTHVLDAFNIPFHDPLDNMVFSFLIDRVGKYQLSMQKVFAYAPMARSMAPMLHEESFHLYTGYDLVRQMAVNAALGNGRWTLADIQQRINAWFPRGLEMFGSPEGGQANVAFGFKDRLNGECISAYTTEVERLLQRINLAVVTARQPDLSREVAEQMALQAPDRLHLPHGDFFRQRGTPEIAYQPVATDGRRLSPDVYWSHLIEVLPGSLRNTEFFDKYRAEFNKANTRSN
jgi:benzoyl-CoA 2,3-epoxidase subunit B